MPTRAALLACLLAAAAPLAPAATTPEEASEASITIGTGSLTGLYYPAGAAICRIVNRFGGEASPTTRCAALAGRGPLGNILELRSGELDFGVVGSGWQHDAWIGDNRFFSGRRVEQLRSVFALYPEPLSVLVRRGQGIERLGDLAGRRVHVALPGAALRPTLDDALREHGLGTDDLVSVELESGDSAKALCDGTVDALVHAAAHPVDAITEASNACEVALLDVRADAALLARKPFYRVATLPGGTYRGIERAVEGFGVGATVVTSAAVSDVLVYRLTQAVFERIDELRRLHPVFADLEAEQMIDAGLTAPLHEGALRYYRERGWR